MIYCGEPDTKAAFIEPLATAERYRQQGLAKACIYESLKRCRALGADIVYVVPDEEPYSWYKRIGFEQKTKSYGWSKSWRNSVNGPRDVSALEILAAREG